eukprot:2290693-Prymnesium_polylepis.1
MKWYRSRAVKCKLHHRALHHVPKAAKKAARGAGPQPELEPAVGSERSRRVGSVSTSTEKAAAVERTVSKAALTRGRSATRTVACGAMEGRVRKRTRHRP